MKHGTGRPFGAGRGEWWFSHRSQTRERRFRWIVFVILSDFSGMPLSLIEFAPHSVWQSACQWRGWIVALAVSFCVSPVFGQPPETPQTPSQPNPAGPKPVSLTPETILETWVFFSAERSAREATWRVEKGATPAETELVCLGLPYGYLRSMEEYEDFEFGLEWRYPKDPNGNSGLLIHTVGEDKIWPKSVQVQLHAPAAGSIFPTGGAMTDNTGAAMGLSKPVNEWNTCVVSCRQGKVTAEINGSKVGEVTGCLPSRGRLCLQSEGAEVHFRRIWIRPLPLANAAAAKEDDDAAPVQETPKTTGTQMSCSGPFERACPIEAWSEWTVAQAAHPGELASAGMFWEFDSRRDARQFRRTTERVQRTSRVVVPGCRDIDTFSPNVIKVRVAPVDQHKTALR